MFVSRREKKYAQTQSHSAVNSLIIENDLMNCLKKKLHEAGDVIHWRIRSDCCMTDH